MPNTETQKTTNPKTEDPLSTTIRWDLQGHRIDLTALNENDRVRLQTLELDGATLTHLRGKIIVSGDVSIRRCPYLTEIQNIQSAKSIRIEDCPKLTKIDVLEAGKNAYVCETAIREITNAWFIGNDLIAENNPDLETVEEPVVGGTASFSHSCGLKSVSGHFSDILFVEECGLESLRATASQIVGINAEEEAALRASDRFLLKQTRRFPADKFNDVACLKRLSEQNSYPEKVSDYHKRQNVSQLSKILCFLTTLGQLICPGRKVVSRSDKEVSGLYSSDRQRV